MPSQITEKDTDPSLCTLFGLDRESDDNHLEPVSSSRFEVTVATFTSVMFTRAHLERRDIRADLSCGEIHGLDEVLGTITQVLSHVESVDFFHE